MFCGKMMLWAPLVIVLLHFSAGGFAQVDGLPDCVLQGQTFQFCTLDRLGDFDIYWSINDSDSSINFAFDTVASGSYYALGFSSQRDLSTNDVMPGTNAVVGCGDANNGLAGDLRNNDFFLGARDSAQIAVEGRQQLTAHEENRINGRCTVFFTRPIAPSSLDVNQHLLNDMRTVVLATGSYSNTIQQHSIATDDRTFFEVNFATGFATANVDVPLNSGLIAHGALMAIAFGLFFPGGILAARHKKFLFGGKEYAGLQWWFHVHRTMMPTGAILSTAGYILILVNQRDALATNSLHFILGTVAMCLSWTQFTFVRLRPKGGKPVSPERMRWNLAHWWNGRTAATCAFANCVVGFRLLLPPVGYFIFFLIVSISIVLTILALDVYTKSQGSAKVEKVEMQAGTSNGHQNIASA